MNYYIRNAITGLYYDGRSCSTAGQGLAWPFALPPHPAFIRATWGPHAEVVRESLTALTLDGKTMTSSGRWVSINS